MVLSQCSREVEIVSPIDSPTLVVSSGGQAQADLSLALEALDWQKETSVKFFAVSSEGVDLLCCIEAPYEAVSIAASGEAPGNDHMPASRRPLALNTYKLPSQIEEHVEPTPLVEWAVHVDSQLERLERDGRLGDRSFLVRCHPSKRSGRLGWAVSAWDSLVLSGAWLN